MNIKNFILSVSVGVALTTLLFSLRDVQVLQSPSLKDDVIRVALPPSTQPSAIPTDPLSGAKVIKKLQLNTDRVVNLSGPIMDSHVAVEISSKSSSEEPLYVLINSPGGSILAGEQILSAIESSKSPVYTVCIGVCASMAAIISQYGKERYGVDRSVLMFHDAAGGVQGYLPHMTSLIEMLNKKIDKMDSFIARRAGLSLDAFKAEQSKNIWIDSEDAVRRNFLDSLVSLNQDIIKQEATPTENRTKQFYLNN